ncbi:MAG: hypothetical protein LBD04_10220 [Synergistaceae bacterium]|jgi:SSS family solute:Na+ symporter|nr:hypothetical protein [Synergistaceae bacterium]
MSAQAIFWIYIAICVLIGVFSSITTNKTKTSANFLTANSTQNVFVVGCSLFAACVSGTAVVGVTNNYWAFGLAAIIYSLTRVVLTLGMGAVVGDKIYRIRTVVVNQMFGQIFLPQDSVLFGVVSSLILIGVAGASIRAAALMLPSLYPALANDLPLCLLLVTILCGSLSTAGGIRATNATNTLHAVCILLGTFLVAAIGIYQNGGLTASIQAMPNARGAHWFDFGGTTMVAFIGAFLGVVVYSYVGQTEWNVSRSARTPRDAKMAFLLSGFLQLLLAILLVGIGMVAVLNVPDLKGSTAMAAAAYSISPILAGVAIAAIFACSVSTAQGMYIAQSTISMGWIKSYCSRTNKQLSDKTQFRVMQALIVLLSAIAFVFCWFAKDLIGFLISLLSIYTPFAIVMLLMFFYPKTCRKSTCTWVFVFSMSFLLTFLFVPTVSAFFQAVAYPLLIGAALGVLVALLTDKRPINIVGLFRTDEEIRADMRREDLRVAELKRKNML